MAENNKHDGNAAPKAEVAVSSSGQCNAIDLLRSLGENFAEYIQSTNGAATLSSIVAIVTVLAFFKQMRFPYASAVSDFGFIVLMVFLGISVLTKAPDTASFKLIRNCLHPHSIAPPQAGSRPEPAIKHTLKLPDRVEVAGKQTLNSHPAVSLNETTVYKERQVRQSLRQSPTIHGNESVHVKTSVKRFCHRLPQGP